MFHERTHRELIKNSFSLLSFQPNFKALVIMFSSFLWEMLKVIFGRNTVTTRSPTLKIGGKSLCQVVLELHMAYRYFVQTFMQSESSGNPVKMPVLIQ